MVQRYEQMRRLQWYKRGAAYHRYVVRSLPALPFLHRKGNIGGDPVGARVLARFQPKIVQEDYQLIFVLNANRPEVRDAESAAAYLRSIEAVTGLTCSGLVNNTHLCGETTPAEIRKGVALAQEVSRQTGIPILCHTAERRFLESLSDLGEPVFPIAINMKKPWER